MSTFTPTLLHQLTSPTRTRPRTTPRSKPAIAPLSTSSLALQRKPGCACGGSCPRCQAKTALQTKLKISQPGDRYEQEADRIANQVMQMPAPSMARLPKAETPLQRKATGATPAMPAALGSLQNGGQPLNASNRDFFEPRFGTDLSQVRIHTAPQAQNIAHDVQARAFTVGSNIVFGAGQYHPGTAAGQQLLAHELTHVLQQTGGNTVEEPSLQRQADTPVGGNACLNRCEEEFRYCLSHRPITQPPDRCIARRQACMHRCPEPTPPTSGFP